MNNHEVFISAIGDDQPEVVSSFAKASSLGELSANGEFFAAVDLLHGPLALLVNANPNDIAGNCNTGNHHPPLM